MIHMIQCDDISLILLHTGQCKYAAQTLYLDSHLLLHLLPSKLVDACACILGIRNCASPSCTPQPLSSWASRQDLPSRSRFS